MFFHKDNHILFCYLIGFGEHLDFAFEDANIAASSAVLEEKYAEERALSMFLHLGWQYYYCGIDTRYYCWGPFLLIIICIERWLEDNLTEEF